VPYGTLPNSAYGRTSFMLGMLGEVSKKEKHLIAGIQGKSLIYKRGE